MTCETNELVTEIMSSNPIRMIQQQIPSPESIHPIRIGWWQRWRPFKKKTESRNWKSAHSSDPKNKQSQVQKSSSGKKARYALVHTPFFRFYNFTSLSTPGLKLFRHRQQHSVRHLLERKLNDPTVNQRRCLTPSLLISSDSDWIESEDRNRIDSEWSPDQRDYNSTVEAWKRRSVM